MMSIRSQFSTSQEVKEPIDVLDEHGLRTGEVLSRKDIHLQGKIHRAVHFYLFDHDNNLLLQRRSLKVDHCANMLGISLTAHVDSGENSSVALYREIKEELNLNPSQMRIHFLFSFRQDAHLNSEYIDRQWNDVYACWHKFNIKDISFNTDEVSELKLIPFSLFKEMVFHKHDELVPFYYKECRDLIYFLNEKKLKLFIDGKF